MIEMEIAGDPEAVARDEDAVEDNGPALGVERDALGLEGRDPRGTLEVARQVEGGLEVFELPLPAVLAAQKGLNEPRYPTLKGIMGAKKKEIKDLKASDLGLAGEAPQLTITALEALPPRPPGRVIQGDVPAAVKELVRSLREDAKAI